MRVGIQRILGAVTVGVVCAVVTAGPVSAQSGGAGQPAEAPTLSLSSLGADGDIALYGFSGSHSITVPVPKGLTPGALTADLELPPYVGGGTLIVTQEDRTLSRVELLATDTTPITIPLTGARVVDDTVSFTVRSRLLPEEGECLFNPTVPLKLTDAAIAYTGSEEVTDTVADFLPPVLARLTIFVPKTPSTAESDAAVKLTTAVVSRYGDQHPEVRLAALPGNGQPPPSGPLERNVVIREGGDPGVAVQGDRAGVPALLITGSGAELDDQVQLLDSELSRLALARKAVAGPTKSSSDQTAKQASLTDLGQPTLSATAFEPRVVLPIDQTRLGGPVRDVRVDLKGSYTPLPSTVGGQIVVSVGDVTLDRWAAESTGTIDRSVTIPNSELERVTDLSIALEIAGNTGQCGEFQPTTLRIDGSTTINSAPDPAQSVGFQSIPQSLLPKTQIGLEEGSLEATSAAVAIGAGLQRLSGPRIDTEVTSLDDAIAGSLPAVLISTDSWDSENVVPPVRSDSDGQLTVSPVGGSGGASLELDPSLKFASLQVGRSGNRTLLFAISDTGPKDLVALLDWLDSEPSRWANLTGTALLARPGAEPVHVDTDEVLAAPTATTTSPLWWIAIGAGVIVLGGIAVLVVRRVAHK